MTERCPNVCSKHKWRGEGDCPSCRGEYDARKALERVKGMFDPCYSEAKAKRGQDDD